MITQSIPTVSCRLAIGQSHTGTQIEIGRIKLLIPALVSWDLKRNVESALANRGRGHGFRLPPIEYAGSRIMVAGDPGYSSGWRLLLEVDLGHDRQTAVLTATGASELLTVLGRMS